FVRAALAALDHRIIAEAGRDLDVDHDAAACLDVATALANDVVERSGIDRERLLGAGVAVSGPIDQETGTLGSTTIMPGWVGLDVAAQLEERLRMPVGLAHHAHLRAPAPP